LGLAESLADPLNVNCYQFYQLLRGSIMGKSVALLVAALAFLLSSPAGAVILIQDFTEPGNQGSPPPFGFQVETFNSVSPTPQTANGTDSFAQFSAGLLTGGSQLPQIVTGSVGNQYAAPYFGVTQPNTIANGQDSTPYLTVYGGAKETITLTGGKQTSAFGLYIGSLDAYNHISFFENGSLVTSIDGTYITQHTIPNDPPKSTQLNNQFNFNSSGYFVFSNIGLFNQVVLSSTTNSFEVDNVGFFLPTTTPPVPETSTWIMMILGFLGVGFVGYRRRGTTFRFA
jgi:hypothetical protein